MEFCYCIRIVQLSFWGEGKKKKRWGSGTGEMIAVIFAGYWGSSWLVVRPWGALRGDKVGNAGEEVGTMRWRGGCVGNGGDAVEESQLSLPGTFQQLVPFPRSVGWSTSAACYVLKHLLKSRRWEFLPADNSEWPSCTRLSDTNSKPQVNQITPSTLFFISQAVNALRHLKSAQLSKAKPGKTILIKINRSASL